MYQISFDNPKKIFFIGIGGISMSGLAEILKTQGFEVLGSDINKSDVTKKLESIGVKVFYGHKKDNITSDIDLVVHTAAVKSDNIEVIESLNKNIPIIDRAELLGQIMNNYKYSIAVSGTHGKTTTTSIMSHILIEAEKDPTISVGGILNIINGNIKIGNSDYFITEACEYCNSFLKFNPYVGIILNIEEDHLDFFEDINDIRKSFIEFANKIPKDGLLIINGDIDNVNDIVAHVDCKVISFGSDISNHTYSANNLEFDTLAHSSFDLIHKGLNLGRIKLNVPGVHNVFNALSCISLALELGIDLETIKRGLLLFNGTKRRFEYKGSISGVTIIDDYAHHPTEITATLNATSNYEHNKTWCVFQPHTYTRTKAFLKDFAESLSIADNIIITDIFAAREKDPGDIHSKDLVNEIKKLGKECYYFSSFDDIEQFLLQNCSQGDMLITMGAGDVKLIGEELLGK